MKSWKIFLAGFIVMALALDAASIANPSASYCIDLGYEYKINQTPQGSTGFCVMPDGTQYNGWEFFSGNAGREYSYCEKKGYETKTVSDERCRYAPECAVCILKDGTEVEVEELIALENAPVKKTTTTKNVPSEAYVPYLIILCVAAVLLSIWMRRNARKKIPQ
jgi:putative hemolysin